MCDFGNGGGVVIILGNPSGEFSYGINADCKIRYNTAFEFGYIVAENKINLANPYDPYTYEFDEFIDGKIAAKNKAP